MKNIYSLMVFEQLYKSQCETRDVVHLQWDSNSDPSVYKPDALPTELSTCDCLRRTFIHLWFSNICINQARCETRDVVCPQWDSNSCPSVYEPDALPTELSKCDCL